MDDKGKPTFVEVQPTLNSNNGTFLLSAAEQGFGIVRVPDFLSHDSFASGKLVPIMTDIRIRDWGIYLVHAEDRRLNRRMRLFQEEMKISCFET